MLQLDADNARKLGRRLQESDDASRHRPRARRAAAPDRRAARVPPQPAWRGRTRRHQRREGPRRRAKTHVRAPADRGNAAPGAEARTRRRRSFALAEASSSQDGGAQLAPWRVDAQVANRASRLSAAMAEAGAMYLPERLHAVRIAMKKLRYAVELSTELAGAENGAGLTCTEARPGAARPPARPAGADRARAAGAGVADAAERDRLARSRHAGGVARGRLPAPPRALHALARSARGDRRRAQRAAAGVASRRAARRGGLADRCPVPTSSI